MIISRTAKSISCGFTVPRIPDAVKAQRDAPTKEFESNALRKFEFNFHDKTNLFNHRPLPSCPTKLVPRPALWWPFSYCDILIRDPFSWPSAQLLSSGYALCIQGRLRGRKKRLPLRHYLSILPEIYLPPIIVTEKSSKLSSPGYSYAQNLYDRLRRRNSRY